MVLIANQGLLSIEILREVTKRANGDGRWPEDQVINLRTYCLQGRPYRVYQNKL